MSRLILFNSRPTHSVPLIFYSSYVVTVFLDVITITVFVTPVTNKSRFPFQSSKPVTSTTIDGVRDLSKRPHFRMTIYLLFPKGGFQAHKLCVTLKHHSPFTPSLTCQRKTLKEYIPATVKIMSLTVTKLIISFAMPNSYEHLQHS